MIEMKVMTGAMRMMLMMLQKGRHRHGTADGLGPLVTNQSFDFSQCTRLDFLVGAFQILIIVCNSFAIWNRNATISRSLKVFHTSSPCCCCGCCCCRCCCCWSGTADKLQSLLTNSSFQSSQEAGPLGRAPGSAVQLLFEVEEPWAIVLTDAILPSPAIVALS